MYEHEDENGWPCHGEHETSSESRSKNKPRLSRDMVSYMESFLVLEVPIDTVFKMNIKEYVDMEAVD